jgi:hypothetical protein
MNTTTGNNIAEAVESALADLAEIRLPADQIRVAEDRQVGAIGWWSADGSESGGLGPDAEWLGGRGSATYVAAMEAMFAAMQEAGCDVDARIQDC